MGIQVLGTPNYECGTLSPKPCSLKPPWPFARCSVKGLPRPALPTAGVGEHLRRKVEVKYSDNKVGEA